jgi:hypothetical protein
MKAVSFNITFIVVTNIFRSLATNSPTKPTSNGSSSHAVRSLHSEEFTLKTIFVPILTHFQQVPPKAAVHAVRHGSSSTSVK